MKAEAAEEYTQSLAQVMSGGWRMIAVAEGLGVPKALGMSTRVWVEQRLGGYVRLSIEERQAAVRELTSGGVSNVKAAAIVGVDEATVRRDVTSANADPKAQKQEISAPRSANAEPRVSAAERKRRVAALPQDLVTRVDEGMSIEEAERVVEQREERVAAYVKRVRVALDLFERMVGHPVPTELSKALSRQERALLRAVIGALEGSTDGQRAIA